MRKVTGSRCIGVGLAGCLLLAGCGGSDDTVPAGTGGSGAGSGDAATTTGGQTSGSGGTTPGSGGATAGDQETGGASAGDSPAGAGAAGSEATDDSGTSASGGSAGDQGSGGSAGTAGSTGTAGTAGTAGTDQAADASSVEPGPEAGEQQDSATTIDASTANPPGCPTRTPINGRACSADAGAPAEVCDYPAADLACSCLMLRGTHTWACVRLRPRDAGVGALDGSVTGRDGGRPRFDAGIVPDGGFRRRDAG